MTRTAGPQGSSPLKQAPKKTLAADEIETLIREVLKTFRAIETVADPRDQPIYGDGVMDSMALVIFLAELEARLAEASGYELVLANEKAMSRSHSPYRNVGALADFVRELLDAAAIRP